MAEGRAETSWPGGSSPAERGGNTDKGSNRSGGTVGAALAWLWGPLGPCPLFQGVPKVVPKVLEQWHGGNPWVLWLEAHARR